MQHIAVLPLRARYRQQLPIIVSKHEQPNGFQRTSVEKGLQKTACRFEMDTVPATSDQRHLVIGFDAKTVKIVYVEQTTIGKAIILPIP